MKRMAFSGLIRRTSLVMIAAVAVMLLSVAPLRAQVDTGTILGTVTDASGAPLVGAKVHAVQLNTNQATDATTDHEGYYTLPYLQPSDYDIEASANGFKKLRRAGVQLRVAQKMDLNFQLELGAITSEFTVTADAVFALVERGVPFLFTMVDAGYMHAHLAVGADRLRRTLLLRQPADRRPKDEAGAEGDADLAEHRRALLRRRHIRDIGERRRIERDARCFQQPFHEPGAAGHAQGRSVGSDPPVEVVGGHDPRR